MNNLHNNNTLHQCFSLPEFVEPTLPPGVCVAVPPGTLFIKQIRATSDSCSNIEIMSIKVFGPNGVPEKTGLNYLHKIHLFILWHLSLVPCELRI